MIEQWAALVPTWTETLAPPPSSLRAAAKSDMHLRCRWLEKGVDRRV